MSSALTKLKLVEICYIKLHPSGVTFYVKEKNNLNLTPCVSMLLQIM